MNEDDVIRAQIEAIIKDEIQEGINEYIDQADEKAVGFVKDEADELKVNIPVDEVDKLIKEYKKIKKNRKSNFAQIKKLGLLDKNGRAL
jgi:LPS O-antigen subunit length determinant protein (WzzB/FepE family)